MRFVEEVQAHLAGLEDMRRATEIQTIDAFGLCGSVFRRRLREEGVTFKQLSDIERVRRLEVLLKRYSKAPAHSVAKVMGYATPEAARRAAERITGVALAELRANHAAPR
jgi:AraC-like DNA-binding protein